MARADRRDKVALDEAYSYYRTVIVEEGQCDLHKLVKSLKTVSRALHSSSNGLFKITHRLWRRIEQALFDKVITSFGGHVVMLDSEGAVLTAQDDLPKDCVIELHPEGLRRADDVFRMPLDDLSPLTQMQVAKLWKERGPSLRKEDFVSYDCESSGLCPMKPFAVGHEVLQQEAVSGKKVAYKQWWELYWQAYCTPDVREKQMLVKQMVSLESVWGNLYY